MELVYLWVEDYKNIQNQGFNFSPRFDCKYNEGTKELTIDEKKDYISIFPENINITAIVGENGSGKSSIVEDIFQFLEVEPLAGTNILIYLEEEKLICITDINPLNLKNINKEIVKIRRNEHSLSSKLFIYNRNYAHQHRYFRNYKTINIDKESVINVLVSNLAQSIDCKLSTFMYLPNKITVKYKDTESLISLFINMQYPAQNELKTRFEKKDDFQQFLITLCARDGIEQELEFYDDESKMIKKIGKSKDVLEAVFFDFLKIRTEKTFSFSEDNKQLIGKYINKEYFELLEFDLIDEKERHYNDLSHGEQTLFGLLLNIYFYSRNQSAIFLLDEPELSLHPQWQKKLLNEIIEILEKLTNKFQLLLTSHSPFILSDVPKENVIFLEKGKQVYPFENKQTFGANIHTLLSHGFFMKNGLMGEFAKKKIQSIIKYHDEILTKELTNKENKKQRDEEKEIYEKEHKKEFWQINSIIGDDYLKQVIKNYLIEIEKIVLGNDEAKKEEIKRLEAQLEQLRKIEC